MQTSVQLIQSEAPTHTHAGLFLFDSRLHVGMYRRRAFADFKQSSIRRIAVEFLHFFHL